MNTKAASIAPSKNRIGKSIISVVPFENYGGMSRFATYYSKEWNESGRRSRIKIVNTYGPGQFWKMPFYFVAAMMRIFCLCATGRAGILHVHMAERLSFWRKASVIRMGQAFGVPSVVHLHAAEFREFFEGLSERRQAVVRDVLNSVPAVVVLGSPWLKYLEDNVGVDPNRLRLIHNGVPDPTPPGSTVRPHNRAPTFRSIAYVAALNERKGIHDLIVALSDPRLRDLDWTCQIAGNGDVNYWKRKAEDAGLREKVIFRGWLSSAQTAEMLALSDIFVLPSYNEGLPLALLEAMAHRLAIVTTPVGAIEDAINSDNGLLVPPGSPDCLANALLKLLQDPDLAMQLANRARADFIDKFEVSRMNDRIENLFGEVVGGQLVT
jgi:glycosyltransferase involved in cell wall biosynthesis